MTTSVRGASDEAAHHCGLSSVATKTRDRFKEAELDRYYDVRAVAIQLE